MKPETMEEVYDRCNRKYRRNECTKGIRGQWGAINYANNKIPAWAERANEIAASIPVHRKPAQRDRSSEARQKCPFCGVTRSGLPALKTHINMKHTTDEN